MYKFYAYAHSALSKILYMAHIQTALSLKFLHCHIDFVYMFIIWSVISQLLYSKMKLSAILLHNSFKRENSDKSQVGVLFFSMDLAEQSKLDFRDNRNNNDYINDDDDDNDDNNNNNKYLFAGG